MLLRPLADHVLCAAVDRATVDRILLSRATTTRDVTAEPSRLVRVGDDDVAFAVVLATGAGRVYASGKRVEPMVRTGDVVLLRATSPKLDLPYRAAELVGGLALDAHVRDAKTFSICEDCFEGVIES